MKQKSINYKYIFNWLKERNLHLDKSFIDNLRDMACEYKKRMV